MGGRRPPCTILGGANGSGKSSLYKVLLPAGKFINADATAKLIAPDDPSSASLAAGRRVLGQLNAMIEAREDFVYETTLSGRQPLEIMRRAKAADYETALVFVVLASVELHIDRVAQRVAGGGHDIPETTIRRRYLKALTRLNTAIRLADETVIVDNTSLAPIPLLRITGGAIVENRLEGDAELHRRLLKTAADATTL